MAINSSSTVPEIAQRIAFPGTDSLKKNIPVVASAASIDLSAVECGDIVRISGTTDIANIKPPYASFSGRISFLFDAASPPDFVSGGSPGTGYYGVALTKSMARYEVVDLFFVPDLALWYPAMT